MLGPHGGRGGQKRPKIGPHGLCMTPSLNFQDRTSTGFCGTSAHEYGKCHGINEISLLRGFQKAPNF